MRPQASILSSSDDPRDPTALARANNGIVEIALHIARIDRRYIVEWPPRQRSVTMATIELAINIALAELTVSP